MQTILSVLKTTWVAGVSAAMFILAVELVWQVLYYLALYIVQEGQ